MKIKITFQKPTYVGRGFMTNLVYELETFYYECNPSLSDRENLDAAYEEAIRRGHKPNKNIMWKFVTTTD